MGILKTRWQTQCRGHLIVVTRSELSKRLSLTWDGVEVAGEDTITGRGELRALVDAGADYRGAGKELEIHAEVSWGGSEELAHGKCRLTVNGKEFPVERID